MGWTGAGAAGSGCGAGSAAGAGELNGLSFVGTSVEGAAGVVSFDSEGAAGVTFGSSFCGWFWSGFTVDSPYG